MAAESPTESRRVLALVGVGVVGLVLLVLLISSVATVILVFLNGGPWYATAWNVLPLVLVSLIGAGVLGLGITLRRR